MSSRFSSPGGHGKHALFRFGKRWLFPYDPACPDAARFRSLQLQSLLALSPGLIVCTLLNVVMLVWVYASAPWILGMVLWGIMAMGMSAVGVSGWLRWRAGAWPTHCSRKTQQRAERNAALTALVWCLPMVWVYPQADAAQSAWQLLVTQGMLGVGTFALATLPRAAVYYALIMEVGTLVGLGLRADPWRVEWLAASGTLALMVLAVAVRMGHHFCARLQAEADSLRWRQLTQTRLDEFEQHAQDWRWELDAQGRLSYVSPRLAESLGRRLVQLEHEPLLRLITQTLSRPTEEQRQALDALHSALLDNEPFTSLHVPVMLAGQLRWWSLSGKPVVDDRGQWCGWRGVGSDVTHRRHHWDEQTHMAIHDSLTGLANRDQLESRLLTYGERPLTLFSLDLQEFHKINAEHGQLVGDQLLQIVASRFRACVRQGDLLVRLQGDNFVLVSWGTLPVTAATNTAQRLLDALRQPCAVDGTLVTVRACVGIVQVEPPMATLFTLLNQAGQALHAAQQQFQQQPNDRGCLVFWSSTLAS